MNQELRKINTLSELKEEKAKLRQEIQISKEEFIHSLHNTGSNAKTIFLKGLVLPAGIVGIAAVGVKAVQALRHGHESEGEQPDEEYLYSSHPSGIIESIKANLASNPKWYIRLLPTVIQLVSSFLAKRYNNQQPEEVEHLDTYPQEAALMQGRQVE